MPWSPQAFPNLGGSFTLMGPATDRYNCVASAAGDDLRWWWPVGADLYWPPGAPRQETAAAFIATFESLGYAICSDGQLEPAVEKIALFMSRSATPTHVARQLESGLWASKLGVEEDITHELHGVDGPAYGAIATFMARVRAATE